jgi:hypothetical protein
VLRRGSWRAQITAGSAIVKFYFKAGADGDPDPSALLGSLQTAVSDGSMDTAMASAGNFLCLRSSLFLSTWRAV